MILRRKTLHKEKSTALVILLRHFTSINTIKRQFSSLCKPLKVEIIHVTHEQGNHEVITEEAKHSAH